MNEQKLYAVKNDKGEWLSFDPSHESVWDTNNPTFFNDKSYAEAQNTGLDGGHVVELVESPENIVVSAEEAEMLKRAKDSCWPAHIFDCGAAGATINSQDRLMRAYVNGWTVEKPKRWYVKVPHTSGDFYRKLDGKELDTVHGCINNVNHTFTDAEIEHYGLQDCEKVEVKN